MAGIFGKSSSAKKAKLKEEQRQQSFGTPNATKNKDKSKKGKSPFRKITRIFKKKKKSTSGKNESLTLVSPEISKEHTEYYSNNTDGFEVILEGRQMTYEENLKKRKPDANKENHDLCGTSTVSEACEPLSDWNNFVNLLLNPNMNGIFDFVYGEDHRDEDRAVNAAASQSRSVAVENRAAPQTHANIRTEEISDPPVPKRIITQKSSTMSLPFDESYERSAIETTLEEPAALQSSSKDHKQDEAEIVEIHPYKKTADGPVQRLRRAAQESDVGADHGEDSSLAFEAGNGQSGRALQPQVSATSQEPGAIPVPPEFESKADVPDEEVYDTVFTLKFLREVSKIGIMLTYFQVPEDGREMKSNVVNLTIKPGLSRGSRLLQPKLCWTDVQNPGNDDGMSISLLGIHSITTSLSPDEEDENPFFTITTEEGEVHAFECPTLSVRNYTVNGIRNVVAWLSYHLVMGNMATGTEIVSDLEEERGESMGELPSLKTPVQAMNDLTHSFLD